MGGWQVKNSNQRPSSSTVGGACEIADGVGCISNQDWPTADSSSALVLIAASFMNTLQSRVACRSTQRQSCRALNGLSNHVQHLARCESSNIKFNVLSQTKIGLFFIVSDQWHCRHSSEFPADSVRPDLFINSLWSWWMNEGQPTRLLFADDKNNVRSW